MRGRRQVLAERFARVLAAVAADPEVRVRQVRVLDAAERAQVVAGWNDTAAAVPAGPVAELFAARAARVPGCGGGGVRGRVGVVRGAGRAGGRGWRGACVRAGAGPESVVAVVPGARRRSW